MNTRPTAPPVAHPVAHPVAAPGPAGVPGRGWRSVTLRMAGVAALVALASSLLTAAALARSAGADNRDTAAVTLAATADTLAARVSTVRRQDPARRPALADRIAQRAGWAAEIVEPGARPVTDPFRPEDVDAAAEDAEAVARTGRGGAEWLVAARPAGGATVLVARRLATIDALTPAQRRRALFAALLGLTVGAVAGIALASTLTRPLARVAAAARRITAGERGAPVPARGPTEVADVARALTSLSVALGESERRRRDFLLAVSHELRTPLTAVTGYAEALADGALPDEEVPRALEVVRTEADRLQRRVADLLALARLEAQDFRLDPAPADLAEVLRSAAAAFAPRAAAAGVELRLVVPERGPVVVTDAERLRQAVDALVDNALRVLPAGAPLVLACGPVPGGAVVEVRDGGPGLAPEDLAVAFERGRLHERYAGRRPVGSGVGLALVGELTRRLGGTPHADLAPEGGARFVLVLPERAPGG